MPDLSERDLASAFAKLAFPSSEEGFDKAKSAAALPPTACAARDVAFSTSAGPVPEFIGFRGERNLSGVESLLDGIVSE